MAGGYDPTNVVLSSVEISTYQYGSLGYWDLSYSWQNTNLPKPLHGLKLATLNNTVYALGK